MPCPRPPAGSKGANGPATACSKPTKACDAGHDVCQPNERGYEIDGKVRATLRQSVRGSNMPNTA